MINLQVFKYGFLYVGVCRVSSGDETAVYFDNEPYIDLYSMIDIVVFDVNIKRLGKRFLKKLYKLRPDLNKEVK